MRPSQKVAAARPKNLVPWLKKHVRWQVVDGLPTARVSLQDTGYLIEWGTEFVKNCTPEELTAAWLHEVAHVIRGDVFIDMAAETYPKQYYWGMEYCINEGLAAVGHRIPEDWVTGAALEKLVGEAPPAPWRGAIAVRDWLIEHGQEGGDPGDIKFTPEAGDAARQAHIKAVLEAPSTPGLPGRNILGQPRVARPATLDITPVAEAAARLAERARDGTTRLWGSSWARESRVYTTLKGWHTVPRGKVVLALDASGSMSEWVPTYWALAEEVRALVDLETWVWADGAAPWDQNEDPPNVGGGTQLAPLLEALAHQEALVIVFTDGMLSDSAEAEQLGARIVWALTPGGEEPFPGLETIQIGKL